MSNHNRNSGARSDWSNLYSEITDKTIAELTAGQVPYHASTSRLGGIDSLGMFRLFFVGETTGWPRLETPAPSPSRQGPLELLLMFNITIAIIILEQEGPW